MWNAQRGRTGCVRAAPAIAALLICLAAAAPDRSPAAEKDDVRGIASRRLPGGAVLERAARGNFGPHRGGIVAVYRQEGNDGCRYGGLALIQAAGGGFREAPLADIRQFDNLTVENAGIGTILFADIDGDRENEALIPVKGMRRGPDSYPLTIVAVQDWKDGAFRALGAYEHYFGDVCDGTARVNAMIATLLLYRGTYHSKTPGVSADLAVALSENGSMEGTWRAVYGHAHMCDPLEFTVRPAGSRAELVKWSEVTGRDEVIGYMAASPSGAVMRFVRDLGEFGCGAWHPSEVRMKRR